MKVQCDGSGPNTLVITHYRGSILRVITSHDYVAINTALILWTNNNTSASHLSISDAMAEQNALLLDAKQGAFAVRTHPIPSPGPGDLLVKIHAVGLNPVDWAVQAYGLFVDKYPVVLGLDAAGEVEQVGEGVVGWLKGDRV